jgi:hypothetical protein
LAAIAIPAYLKYMASSAAGAANANFESAIRAVRAEQTERALPTGNPSPNVLVVCDPNNGNAVTEKKSPMNPNVTAFVGAGAPAADGQVSIDITDFTLAGTPPAAGGVAVTIAVDNVPDGAAAANRSEVVTLNP